MPTWRIPPPSRLRSRCSTGSRARLVATSEPAGAPSPLLSATLTVSAHVASGVKLSEYAACADTVSVALSKGLGAPAGSLVATTRARLPLLQRLRKRLGGGMRQVGILAAAGLYAL